MRSAEPCAEPLKSPAKPPGCTARLFTSGKTAKSLPKSREGVASLAHFDVLRIPKKVLVIRARVRVKRYGQ